MPIRPVIVKEDIVLVPLGPGRGENKFAIIDVADVEIVRGHNWYLDKDGYAIRHSLTPDGRQTTIKLHREILNPPAGCQVDHIDHSRLDNRRRNLRVCTNVENHRNPNGLTRRNTSGYRGIHQLKRTGRWQAAIYIDKRKKHLGYFSTPIEAAIAFDEAARLHYGAFYTPNIDLLTTHASDKGNNSCQKVS